MSSDSVEFGEELTPDRRTGGGRILAALLLLALVVRGSLVASLVPVFFYGEELEKGAAARGLLDGIDLPYPQLAYHLYEGGGFVISHLEALAFLLVGDSILAIKLVAILWGLLVLAAGWVLVRRHFGVRAATFFGLLLVFAPQPFQVLALLALGIHLEACLFLALVFDRGLRLLRSGAPRDALWLGVASGFGIYFSYQLVPVVGYVGLVLLVRAPRTVFGRPGVFGVVGLLLGLVPFFLVWASVGSALFDIHGTDLAGGKPERWKHITDFLSSIFLEGSWVARGMHVAYALVFLFALPCAVLCGRREVRGAAAVLAGFAGIWLVAYLASGFVVGRVYHPFLWMRFAPLWFVLTALLAVALSSRPRIAAALVLLGVLQTGGLLAGASPASAPAQLARLANTHGQDYEGYLVKVLPRVGVDVPSLRAVAGFRVADREGLWTDVARAAWRARPEEATVDLLREALPEAGPALARGLGGWAWSKGQGQREGALAFARSLGEPWSTALQEGAGFRGNGAAWTAPAMIVELEGLPADEALTPYLRGVGERIHRRLVVGPYEPSLCLRPEAARAWIGARREDQRAALLAGFEASLRRSLRDTVR